jgi:hypothetical protein
MWGTDLTATVTGNATAIKRIWLRHGATEFRIARVHTGQNTITFRDWEAFGKASQGATTDDEFLKMMDASHANGRMTSRNITVEIELK